MNSSTTTSQQSDKKMQNADCGPGGCNMRPAEDLVNYVRTYAREKPDVAALWCFGIGLVVGWKLKPW